MSSFVVLNWMQALVATTHGLANNDDFPYATGLSDLLVRLFALFRIFFSVEYFDSQGLIFLS
jgi:hypothetical protein